jgi:hypothetical protein
VLASPMLAGANDLLAAAAIEAGLPAICQWFESAEAGCFSSYGPTLAEVFRTAGSQLALVLVGPAIVSLRIAHQDACANQLEEDVYKPPLAWKPVVTFPPEVGSLEISALGAWDHSEPTYEEIVAKVQRAIDDWKKTKQALETQEAGRLLGLVLRPTCARWQGNFETTASTVSGRVKDSERPSAEMTDRHGLSVQAFVLG